MRLRAPLTTVYKSAPNKVTLDNGSGEYNRCRLLPCSRGYPAA